MPRYIDADALRKEFSERPPDYYTTGYILGTIDRQPTLSPADVRGAGKWIKLDAHKGMEQYKCSACNTPMYVPECMGEPMYSFCPNCGAKMEVSEDA